MTNHSTEDNYQHFLSYSGMEHTELLRYAYFHGANADCEKPSVDRSMTPEHMFECICDELKVQMDPSLYEAVRVFAARLSA